MEGSPILLTGTNRWALGEPNGTYSLERWFILHHLRVERWSTSLISHQLLEGSHHLLVCTLAVSVLGCLKGKPGEP